MRRLLALALLLLPASAAAAGISVEKAADESWYVIKSTTGWVRAWGNAFPTGTFTAPTAGDRFDRSDQKKTYTWDGDSWELEDDWTQPTSTEGGGAPGGLPSGLIVMTLTSCPAGFSQVTALNGKFVLGTLAANGDVAGTGGADNVTPAGTVSAPTFTGSSASTSNNSGGTPAGTVAWPAGVPTFTGSALGTHAHELPFQLVSGTSMRHLPSATFGTGTSRAASGADTTTGNTTSAAVALSQAVTAGTPAGTIAWPAGVPTFSGSALSNHGHTVTATGTNSAPSFTGTSQDNRPAFVKVIFCSAN